MRFTNKSRKHVLTTAMAVLTLVTMFAFTPTSSAQDDDRDSRFRTALKGDPINGVKPHGRAEFERRDHDGNGDRNDQRRRFSAEVDKVNLADGTTLEVDVDGVKVGDMNLKGGSGDLQVHGKNAPKVKQGSQVTVTSNGQTILAGKF